jgi:hypothetical protein
MKKKGLSERIKNFDFFGVLERAVKPKMNNTWSANGI